MRGGHHALRLGHKVRLVLRKVLCLGRVRLEIIQFNGSHRLSVAHSLPVTESQGLDALAFMQFPIKRLPLRCLAAFQKAHERQPIRLASLRRLRPGQLRCRWHEVPEGPRFLAHTAFEHAALPTDPLSPPAPFLSPTVPDAPAKKQFPAMRLVKLELEVSARVCVF